MNVIKSISIIGAGNLAHHLGKAFAGRIKIYSVYSRTHAKTQVLAKKLDCFAAEKLEQIIPADLILVCVNDDSINHIISTLPKSQKIAYTSGAVELETLNRQVDVGVLYPLQTFSLDKSVDLSNVPFFIEAGNEELSQSLFNLAGMLSEKVVYANSADRKNLHVAAVFVNNFSNHMVHIADDFLKSKNLEWTYLLPLLSETVEKLEYSSPFDAQTGPGRRGDEKTLNEHSEMLSGIQKKLYQLITKSIQTTYKK
jgi:predicted short-subunit dehydrogenase-like oxidoreductase (DUF2520 family)